jgi:uncharacterized protein (UPF0218 family)
MPVKLRLTPQIRTVLKQPLGILIRGSFVETMKRLKKMVAEDDPPSIIAVGDTVSKNLSKNGFAPKILIMDNKSKRKNTRPLRLTADRTIYTVNPQGTITQEAEEAVEGAIKAEQSSKIVVDGEEDLLTLVAIAHAPEDSYVVYGQPDEGIVVVKVTTEKKAEIGRILESMEAP